MRASIISRSLCLKATLHDCRCPERVYSLGPMAEGGDYARNVTTSSNHSGFGGILSCR